MSSWSSWPIGMILVKKSYIQAWLILLTTPPREFVEITSKDISTSRALESDINRINVLWHDAVALTNRLASLTWNLQLSVSPMHLVVPAILQFCCILNEQAVPLSVYAMVIDRNKSWWYGPALEWSNSDRAARVRLKSSRRCVIICPTQSNSREIIFHPTKHNNLPNR